MNHLTIASVRCQVEPDAGDFVLAPNLLPFLTPEPLPPVDLRLALRQETAPLPATVGGSAQSVVHDGGLEFVRSQGILTAGAGFADCLVRLNPGAAEAFGGQPWLMLALWGYLAHHRGLLLHGACCELDGRIVLLLGDRQVGKSTLARLVVAAGGACLTDEYPFLVREGEALVAHGSPWPGIVGAPRPLSGPPAGIFILRHAPENLVTPLSPLECARRLTAINRFFTWSPATLPLAFEIIDQAARTVPAFDLGFVPDHTATAALRRVL